jgi:hypothetical protein
MPLLSKKPFPLRDVYFLLNHGLIKSTVLKRPGAGRGKRLIDCDSIDKFLEKNSTDKWHAMALQKGPYTKPSRPRKKAPAKPKLTEAA